MMNRQERIENCIQKEFPEALGMELDNESSQHSRGEESHYRLVLVDKSFAGQSRVQRQRHVMALLKGEFDSGLHSLTLRLLTPEENQAQKSPLTSPGCLGHSN